MVAATRSQASSKPRSSSDPASRSRPVKANAAQKANSKVAVTKGQTKAAPPLDPTTVLPIMYQLLSRLSADSSTICPSQVARKLHETKASAYPDWRALMDPVRNIIWAESETGRVEITQGGVARSLEEREGLKGPIRVRRGPGYHSSA
jgi:hypothetical protein